MSELRDHLKAGFSATANASEEKQEPSVSDVAVRIKTLKAANTVEAAPQHSQRKVTASEEPITARIRRMREQAKQDEADEPDEMTAEKPMGFADRILAERRRNSEGEGHGPS
ncbi:MAG: hypothetical protein ACKOEO_06310 [Planctomycetaceae bacterium]